MSESEAYTPPGKQPRERAVPCAKCGPGRTETMTFNWSGLCDRHGGGQPSVLVTELMEQPVVRKPSIARQQPRTQGAAGPVVTGVVTSTTGWNIADAVNMLVEGYTLAHTVARTGFPLSFLVARYRMATGKAYIDA